jgi:hypothetical protein
MKPSEELIKSEIAKLKEIKPRVPRTNYFQEDNFSLTSTE